MRSASFSASPCSIARIPYLLGYIRNEGRIATPIFADQRRDVQLVQAHASGSNDPNMRAVVCRKLGDPTLPFDAPNCPLELVNDQPQAKLGPRDVRIRVVAAALNFADALMVQGKYQEKPPLPFIPASECSGVVIEVRDG